MAMDKKVAAVPDSGQAATDLRVHPSVPGEASKPKQPKQLTLAKPPKPVLPADNPVTPQAEEKMADGDDDSIVLQFIDKQAGAIKAEASVEIADTPVKRRVGLSKRAFLPSGRGMFFDKVGAYWMKDVNFPLDILFLDKEGAVLELQHMPMVQEPDPLKPLYTPGSVKAAHALELPAGWCEAHNVLVGDTVRVVTKIAQDLMSAAKTQMLRPSLTPPIPTPESFSGLRNLLPQFSAGEFEGMNAKAVQSELKRRVGAKIQRAVISKLPFSPGARKHLGRIGVELDNPALQELRGDVPTGETSGKVTYRFKF